jgi:hypothetical protein
MRGKRNRLTHTNRIQLRNLAGMFLNQVRELVHARCSLEPGVFAPWPGCECRSRVLHGEVHVFWTGNLDRCWDGFAVVGVDDGECFG